MDYTHVDWDGTRDVIGNSVNRHLDIQIFSDLEVGDLLLYFGFNWGGVAGDDLFGSVSGNGPWTDAGGVITADSGGVPIHYGLFWHIVDADDNLTGGAVTYAMRIDAFSPGSATGNATLHVLRPIGGTWDTVTVDTFETAANSSDAAALGSFDANLGDFSRTGIAANEAVIRFSTEFNRNMTPNVSLNATNEQYSPLAASLKEISNIGGLPPAFNGVNATDQTEDIVTYLGNMGADQSVTGRTGTWTGARTAIPRRGHAYDYLAVVSMTEDAPAAEREYAPKSADLVAFNRRVQITELPYQISTTMIKRPE